MRKHVQTDASWRHFLALFGECFFFSGTVGLGLKGFQEKKGILVFQANLSLLKVSVKSGVRCESTDRKLAQEQAKAYRALKRAVRCLSLE